MFRAPAPPDRVLQEIYETLLQPRCLLPRTPYRFARGRRVVRTVKVDPKTKLTDGGVDFRTLNPNGYVPVLQLDNGELLTEAVVILQYIADQHPAAALAPPAGTMARYRLLEWLNFISSELHKTYSVLFAPTTPEEYKTVAREKLAQRLGHVERKLAGRQYLLGDSFTIADVYLFVIVNWSRVTGVDLTAFPTLQQFQAHIVKRPAVQTAMKAEGLVK
ncbi:MAG TPA: glutathione transferase GstA [Povalibacter sp.]|nr:glutathione transferase GstA [Povalibacter sp.]